MSKVKIKIFDYGTEEISYLKKADRQLGEAIDRIGRVDRPVIPDLFQALVHSIVGQQISTKAASTIWSRMQERFGGISADIISALDINEIQQCGMTLRKAGYIKGIAQSVFSGDLNLDSLYDLQDIEVIKLLSSLNGIGVWTAEMLLINSMERPDVISWGDLGIRRGMMRLYGLSELTKKQFDEYRKGYSPYGSVASIYLWKLSAD
ncbi:MAG: DNA-3-methyladenine glycosylase [Clostridiaceae bacterium]